MQVFTAVTGAIGTNTYLVYDDESKKGFIVDPGDYSKVLTSMAQEKKLDIEYIIITHGHADHIMGVGEFREKFPNCRVVAAKAEKAMLNDCKVNMSTQFGKPVEIEADIYVSDGDRMTCGNEEAVFLFTPGHSPGGMCVYIPSSDILFCGDTLFRNSIGRTDFPGCSFEALSSSIHEKLWPLPDETIAYPGHMDPTTIGFEKRNNPFV